ncbi:hypothetical protein SELMODRAFT_76976 [Selaginella moellendorffii]|uniref:VOC domain-containing protein n=1 Tax=Selaginella moellendorffii TaxID=88036 RepID=D8QTC5_SELML|nr:uncharacterized protein LOC9629160 [Selaginella moellendorffii]XP_002980912.1 uncharacterized protein LOC9657339 [Selaginella moellendorffii]EFJ18097.1 hypothetical protein SELMODRAFT_113304 [Selaginella moellendorffii]EFJ36623.1 hypothetical protein SELMODRAFT_76976 [Selaginella moellendorffii]|eukprot:XP_002961363.1 uncharacterized protein LOC9629160 [Selaginella moellendorffii]
MATAVRHLVQLHADVPKAAKLYSNALGFTVAVCTERWAELTCGDFKIAMMQAPSDTKPAKNYSSFISVSVPDIDDTVVKLISMGAELDGPIKYQAHGKVAALRCLDGHMIGLYESSS